MLFVANRNFTLRSKTGHMIRFEKDKPREVPLDVRREAMAVGIIPADGKANTVEDVDSALSVSMPMPNDLRTALIFYALDKMREENDNTKFDAAGRPKVDSVNAYFHGYLHINATDRTKFWDEYKALSGSGEDVPGHRDLRTFLDLAGMTSRDEAADYAKILGIDETVVESVSIRDARKILLNKLFGA
jgi:hypothetical protein